MALINNNKFNEKLDNCEAIAPIIGGYNGLSAKTLAKAEFELGESTVKQEACLKQLRQIINDSIPDDSNVNAKIKDADDRFFVRFLRAKKYDTEKTWELIQGYMKYHKKYPKVVKPLTEEELHTRLANAQPGLLPKRDREGRIVFVFKIKDWNPYSYPFWKVVQTYVYLLELLLENEETQVNGIVILEDFEDYSFSQMTAVGMSDYKKLISLLQGSYPIRVKGVHVFNQPEIFVKIYNLISVFLRGKLLSRVHMYGKQRDSMYEHVPKDIVPVDFGGTAPPYDGNAMADLILGQKKTT